MAKKKELSQLDIDSSNAIKAGMSYGKYMALAKPLIQPLKEEPASERACPYCGKDMTYEHAGKKYCSTYCRQSHYYETKVAKPPVEKVCPICGASFKGNGRDKYCSKHCAQIACERRTLGYRMQKAEAVAL